jgi:hypothetical protein
MLILRPARHGRTMSTPGLGCMAFSRLTKLCMHLRKPTLFQTLWIFMLSVSSPVLAAEIYPVYTQNQSPLVQIYGLPAPESAIVLPPGKIRSLLAVDVASNFGVDQKPNEKIILDGESYRAMIGFRYGLVKGFEAGIDIPYLFYSGGFLDDSIQTFHDTFGFNQGGRKSVPKDRLLFQYTRNGVDQFKITRPNSGIGDIRLLGGMQLYKDESAYPLALALRASLKLPTGYSGELQGSGSTDFALWLAGSDDYKVGSGHVTLYGSVGGLVMSTGDVLPRQQRNLVAFGTAGIGWSPLDWFALKAQANAHTPFYTDSGLVEVNSNALQFIVGTTFVLPAKIQVDFAVSEDLIQPSSSPDVVFQMALRREF